MTALALGLAALGVGVVVVVLGMALLVARPARRARWRHAMAPIPPPTLPQAVRSQPGPVSLPPPGPGALLGAGLGVSPPDLLDSCPVCGLGRQRGSVGPSPCGHGRAA